MLLKALMSMRTSSPFLFLIAVATLGGCAPKGESAPTASATPAPYVRPAADPWVVSCTDENAETPAWLANGGVGIRVGRMGWGDESVQLLAFSLSSYDSTGEEKIRPLPNPAELDVRIDGQPITIDSSSDYSQRLDMRTGVLTTSWQASTPGGPVSVLVELAIGSDGALAQRVTLDSQSNHDVRIAWPTYFNPSQGQAPWEWSWTSNVADHTITKSTATYSLSPNTKDAFPIVFERLVWPKGAKSPKSIDHVFKGAAQDWDVDIEIDGPIEDQQAIRSFLYYLRAGIPPRGSYPVSPLMTSGQTYNGHVFWDADMWVFPALALLDPDRARTIPAYRLRMADAARSNLAQRKSFQLGPGWTPPGSKPSTSALQFPWESSVTGHETSPTETKQQHHVSAVVALSLGMASDLSLIPRSQAVSIGKGVAEFYRWRRTYVPPMPDHDEWTIKDTISPDEHHRGDDDLFTNVAAEMVMRRWGGEPNSTFVRPKDAQGLLNYTNDRGKGYKQAAGVLAIYPLQDPEAEINARTMMDRFAGQTSANGPAMSDSVHALIWARLGESDKGYETWKKSWEEFTARPLNLFSEKRRKDVTYFTTGAAGCLQTVLYGFVGFRIDSKQLPGSAWSIPLDNGRALSVKPNLPKAWKQVTVKNFTVRGKRFTLTVDHDGVHVIPGDS